MEKEAINRAISTATGLPTQNFYGDLNAIREAVSAIESPNMQLTFGNNLIEVCDRDKPKAVDTFHIINATAAQRAEAFLRTIGKWEEDSFPTIPATGKPITQQEMEDNE